LRTTTSVRVVNEKEREVTPSGARIEAPIGWGLCGRIWGGGIPLRPPSGGED